MVLSGLSRVQTSPVFETLGWGTESSVTEARPPRVSLVQEGANTSRCEVCGEAPLVPPGRRVGGQHSAQRGLWPQDVVREHMECRWMGECSPSHCDTQAYR